MDVAKTAIWGPLWEKAWVKVKGGFDLAEGGYSETSMRAMTGVPVIRSAALSGTTNQAGLDTVFAEI